MKVLLFSDLHAHPFKSYSEVLSTGVNSRLQDAIDALDRIATTVAEQKIPLVIFGGDLFHVKPNINIQTFNLIWDAFSRIVATGTQLVLLVGNHDQLTQDGEMHSAHAFASIATVIDEPDYLCKRVGDELVHFFFIPHNYDADVLRAQLKMTFEELGAPIEPHALIGHFGITGMEVGANFILNDENLLTLGELQPDKWTRVFLGHYHKVQSVGNVQYLGALLQHNWGDVGQKRGFWIWDTVTNDCEFHSSHAPEFAEYSIEDLGNDPPAGKFIKIKYRPEQAALVEPYQNLPGYQLDMIKPEQEVITASSATIGLDEAMEEYVQKAEKYELDSVELLHLGQELLKRALKE